MQEQILKNLTLTMFARKGAENKIQFFLVGLVPAHIVWVDGVKEKIELAQRIPIEPFSEAKTLLNKRVLHKDFEQKLKKEYLEALVKKLTDDIEVVQKEKKLAGKEFSFLALNG